MSSFTKTLTYTPATLPVNDTIHAVPLKDDASPGAFVTGDPPTFGTPSDTSVVTADAPTDSGVSLPIHLLKAGTATMVISADGVTTTLTIRVNPPFGQIDVHSDASATFCAEGPLTPAS